MDQVNYSTTETCHIYRELKFIIVVITFKIKWENDKSWFHKFCKITIIVLIKYLGDWNFDKNKIEE